VKSPGGQMSAYRKALRYSEEACQLDAGNGVMLNTLGVAHYRAGNYEKALETLRRSGVINQAQFQGSLSADIAFLPMTQRRLDDDNEARAEFQRLRERMKDPRLAQDAESRVFVGEAEALRTTPKTPGDE
jgi:hypothetical protein